jgi:hypothetical protein
MKIHLVLFVVIILISGCKNYVQVFNTSSSLKMMDENTYIHENDSLKITYNFWKGNGLMSFSIFNKLDKPL